MLSVIKDNLLIKLLIGICAGILVGMSNIDFLMRFVVTVSGVFGSFLTFVIPLIILAFITKGISELGMNSKKVLLMTVAISYLSTVIVGSVVGFADILLFPNLLAGSNIIDIAQSDAVLESYLTLEMPALMPVVTALLLAFILGLGISNNSFPILKQAFEEFHNIIYNLISSFVIPFLPFYIAGVFTKITYSGQSLEVLLAFSKVFITVICFHWVVLFVQYTIAGFISGRNPLQLLRNMLPAYFTALGTQSSVATVPVTVNSIKKNHVKPEISEFTASLCANIHMSGSMTTITSCAIAVLVLSGSSVQLSQIIGFVLMLGVMIVAAPGLPGGAIIASVSVLQSYLGFDTDQVALMITLYIAQDSFGTACNVTGDGAIAVIINKISEKETLKVPDQLKPSGA